jgi:chitodextrinase
MSKALRVPSLVVTILFAAAVVNAAPKPPKPGPTPTPGPSGGDRQAPTTPTNLRVTGATAYNVSFAWDPSTDNSGSFVYRICCGENSSATVPAPASSYTFVGGVRPNKTYSFRMFAQDAAGNVSNYSNSVTVTTPADLSPPTNPVITLNAVGPTHVALSWSASDEGGPLWFNVFKDGAPYFQITRQTSGNVVFLEYETTYTFTVQARDYSGKLSPISDPVVATTEPRNTNDTTPPSTPPNFWGDVVDHSAGEVNMFWQPSTDDVTPGSLIRYDIYLNGVFDHATTGGWERAVVYAVLGALNTIEVFAVDEAGNRSAPATLVVDLRF